MTAYGPPFTLTLTFPPSQPASVATQWSKLMRGTLPLAGNWTGLRSRCCRAVASSPTTQVPWSGSAAKKAFPFLWSGRLPTTFQLSTGKSPDCAALLTVQNLLVLAAFSKLSVKTFFGAFGLGGQTAGGLCASSGWKPQARRRAHFDCLHGRLDLVAVAA